MKLDPDNTSRQSPVNPVLDGTAASQETVPVLAADRPVQEYLDTSMFPALPAGISRSAIHALATAVSHFNWEILTRQDGDRSKSIVIFGELHGSNDPLSVERAKSVLEHFDTRATEGIIAANYPLSAQFRETLFNHERAGFSFGGAISQTNDDIIRQSEHVSVLLDELIVRLNTYADELEQQPGSRRAIVFQASDFSVPSPIFNVVMTGLGLQLAETLKTPQPNEQTAEDSAQELSTPGVVARFDLELNHRPSIFGKLHAINDAAGLAAQKFLSNDRVIGSLLTAGLIIFPAATAAHIATSSTLAATTYYLSLPAAATLGGMLSVAQARKYLRLMRKIDAAVKQVNEFLQQKDLTERDKTMSAETCRILDENPSIPSLLVQVGQAHVPGIKAQLEKAGWRSTASATSELPK